MSRVYISVLGTNNYVPCTYVYDPEGFTFDDVRFVQEATIQYYKQTGTDKDRLFVLVTQAAYDRNWVDNGHRDRNGEIIQCEGLGSRLAKLNIDPQLVFIPEGHSVDQIWAIFNEIYGILSSGDSVTFDITHSFRSLPMLIMVVLNYTKVLKNITIERIDYGAFEKLGSIPDVLKLPLQNRLVPIINLKSFDNLLDWTHAIDIFIASGNAQRVTRLTQSGVSEILKESKGKNQEAQGLKRLASAMQEFSRNISTSRCLGISASASKLKELSSDPAQSDGMDPLYPLLGRLQSELDNFGHNEFMDGVQAAKWCCDHNLIQQGYTILLETMIGFICSFTGLNHTCLCERDLVNMAVKIWSDNLPYQVWHPKAQARKDDLENCLQFLNENKELVKLHRDLNNLRNDMNHCGCRPGPTPPQRLELKLIEFVCRAEQVVKHLQTSNSDNQVLDCGERI